MSTELHTGITLTLHSVGIVRHESETLDGTTVFSVTTQCETCNWAHESAWEFPAESVVRRVEADAERRRTNHIRAEWKKAI